MQLEHKIRLDAKLKKLLVSQDRPLRQETFDSITIFDGFNLPIFVKHLCFYGPKHQILDKFNEVHFLSRHRQTGPRALGKRNLCWETVKLKHLQNGTLKMSVREVPTDRGVGKVTKFLKSNCIMAVSFDKSTGFSVMKRQSYPKKLAETLDCFQFQDFASVGDNIAVNIVKDIDSALLDLKKSSFFSEKVYQKRRSTGGKSARH